MPGLSGYSGNFGLGGLGRDNPQTNLGATAQALTRKLSIGEISSINEGSTLNIVLTTTGVANGTVIPYEIVGSVSSADIVNISTSGNFTIANNSATISAVLAQDGLTEGPEIFTLQLPGTYPLVAFSIVVNDTSDAQNSSTVTKLVSSSTVVITTITSSSGLVATGGVIQNISGTTYHIFSNTSVTSQFVVANNPNGQTIDVLTIAGGGGGGFNIGGGGGAGGFLYSTGVAAPPGTINVTVGAGGRGAYRYATPSFGGRSGSNSQFGSLTAAVGGGAGGGWDGGDGGDAYGVGASGGGSGGGAGGSIYIAGSGGYGAGGTPGQGNSGAGDGYGNGGGGGGAGAASLGITGGAGKLNPFQDTQIGQLYNGQYYLAGGGGAAGAAGYGAGTGGVGGGGYGTTNDFGGTGQSGQTYGAGGGGGTGGGSGGGGSGAGGIVIVRYLGQTSITTSATYTISSLNFRTLEGSSISVTLNTTNIANGSLVPYVIAGTNITTSDLGGASLTGNFLINNGTSTTNFVLTNDGITEGDETVIFSVYSAAIPLIITDNPVVLPLAPIIGLAQSTGPNSASVSFSPPSSDGGSPITGYTVVSEPGNISASGTTSPIIVSGLSSSILYTFTVYATNIVGNGPNSLPSNIISGVLDTVEVLVVGGGGSGGYGASGGGGAGGLYYNATFAISKSTAYTVTIGGGGPYAYPDVYGSNGGNSVFSNITGLGGGYGGAGATGLLGWNANSGGSGGGGGAYNGAAGAGLQPSSSSGGFGNNGGAASGSAWAAGGGGGAGAVGAPFSGSAGGNGGIGKQYSITGTATYYAGGGGGAGDGGKGLGGAGGGGDGGAGDPSNGSNASPNTGGGGGGSRGGGTVSGSGGSGIVIIAYPSAYGAITTISPGLTYTVDIGVTRPGYRVYKFTQGTGPITF
jgi:hypothetical protein